ncbi:MAG: aminotransferase class I/II-fold pyridoxal phosphate-dependent enzyme [Bdellovibrionales bacterium]|nr:aminotransferase class I/II-fold pyridoxal phosphate-dependent enzyme [Bdellovibrionales bacterium]
MSRKPRRRRYNIKADKLISIHLQTSTCFDLKGSLKDISKTGCSFEVKNTEDTDSLKIGDLLPLGKLSFEDNEWEFGRSVIKFIHTKEELTLFGIMFVDIMAPVDTTFSHYIDLDFSKPTTSSELEIDSMGSTLGDFLEKNSESNDIFKKAYDFQYYFQSLKENDRWGYWLIRKPSSGTKINLTKKRANRRDDFIVMASNDYLGLSSHPEVVEAAKKGLDLYGFGATGSPVTTGQTEEHQKLEHKLSEVFNTESATLFNSGYAANLGTISCLAGVNDLLIADILSHASIADGMLQSKATSRLFKHNDMEHLETILERYREKADGAMIIAEGVFSMDGDSAPLNEIYKLAKKYNCRLMLDDAHSFGVLGTNGLGSAEKYDLHGNIDLTMGTFSKICGTIGGFMCGSKEVIDWINISARSVFFSVGLPPSTVMATLKSLEIFQKEPERRSHLRENISFFVDGLRELGFEIDKNHDSAIVPVIIGDDELLGKMYKILFDAGVYTIPVVYPAVSKNSSRFRFTVSAIHSKVDLDYVLLVIEKALNELKINPKKMCRDVS